MPRDLREGSRRICTAVGNARDERVFLLKFLASIIYKIVQISQIESNVMSK